MVPAPTPPQGFVGLDIHKHYLGPTPCDSFPHPTLLTLYICPHATDRPVPSTLGP